MTTNTPHQMADTSRESAAQALAALEGILTRNSAAVPNTETRMALLARAQLRGWVQYPQQGDTPHNVRERGRRLAKALAEGDVETIALLGVKRGCSEKVATTKDKLR